MAPVNIAALIEATFSNHTTSAQILPSNNSYDGESVSRKFETVGRIDTNNISQ